MMPKIFFYTTSTEGSPENAYFQDLIINLATGFDQLGIEYYANYNYWQISPDSDRTLLKQNADITHHDCDIVVLERQYYEKNGCLPEGLFAASRQYKTVYLDCNDGIRTLSWLPEFKNFDFIFKTHYAKHTNYPDNFYPWAFGLSERVLTELEDQIPWAEKQPSVLVNFRNKKFSHSLRGYIQKSFAPEIQKIMPINAASDSESDFPQDPYHYLRWSQTGRRHYPNYFRRLQESQACACFGGFFLGPEFTDKSDRISHYISKIISMAGVKTNRIGQWDSWRFWESMVAGCITLHVDFEKYGFELPVMPENWRHYIGIDLDNITESIERIADQPELLEYIATEGRAWAIAHYAPKPTAIRFLETVAGLKSADLVQTSTRGEFSPMNPDILVSIIINNYNYERFLAEAIDSALNQTYEQIEVIVVDDGSTDNSRQIIGSYGDRIIPILQFNGKQAAAFNSGFAHSRGEIIIFLDSDDYLFPQAVTEIVKIWQPNLAKVHYRLNVVDGVGESLGYSSPQGTVPLSQGKVWQTLLETGCYNSTPTSGNALSRQALTNLFPIPDQYKLTADDYLSFQVPFYGDVAAIEQPLGVYRVHDSNQWALATVTGDRFKRFVRHDLQNFALLTKKAQELGYKVPPDLEQRSIGRLWSRIISLRLNAQTHPVQSDRSGQLIYQGIRSLWKYSEFNFPKRIFYSLWFIWVGLMPLSLAKPAISWLFAPHHRPKLVSWTTNKLRTLMS